MTMVSTSAFYERSTQDMTALRARAEGLQAAMGRGERLSRSSDDPVAASRLRGLARGDSFAAIDTTNANRAISDLTLTDTALASFAEYITRAKELAVQAASNTLTPAQRAGIGTELAQLHGNLAALANARDSAGHALFGGETAGQAFTIDAAGNPVYAGTASAGELPLGEGLSVTRGLTGPEFLSFNASSGPTDIFTVIKGLADALQGGAIDPAQAARDTLGVLDNGLEAVTTAQTVIGARLNWIDLTTQRRTEMTELRAEEQSEIGGTDLAATITRLQEALTVLEASQASFAKLSSLSLFDVLR
jgi:flagellar hook-associated protein 3 FlgL